MCVDVDVDVDVDIDVDEIRFSFLLLPYLGIKFISISCLVEYWNTRSNKIEMNKWL